MRWLSLPVALGSVSLLVSMLFVACSPDRSPVTPAPTDGEPIASLTIGPAGGNLATDDLIVAVPPGSFSESAELKLYADESDDTLAAPPLSPRFRLEGLPAEFTQPIEVRLRATAKLDEASVLLLGADAFLPSQGKAATQWSYLEAADSAGWIQGRLDAPTPLAAVARATLDRPVAAVRILAARIDRTLVTPAGHFRIWTPLASVTDEQLAALGTHLEDAYRRHQQLGFSYAARTRWPVSVSVTVLAATVDGYYSASIFGVNYGSLEFNSLRMDNLAEIRVTAAHEFLHLVQGLYDPRSGWAQASGGGPQYWLDEATAVWCESHFHDDPHYCSSVRQNNELTPLGGLTAGLTVGESFHGYGLSSMIRYREQQGDSSFIVAAYQDIKNHAVPVEAIRRFVAAPMKSWWWQYLHALVAGEIYSDVSSAVAVRERRGLFRIVSAADSVHTYQTQLPDLSGMVYLVRLDDREISSSSALKIRVTGGECALSAFRLVGTTPLVPLGQAADSLLVPGLRALATEGAQLVILVANRRDSSPGYTGTSPVTLSFRVTRGIDLSRYGVPWLGLTYHAHWGNWAGGRWEIERQGLYFPQMPEGSFEGSTFTAEWDSTESGSGMHYTGHFRAVLDPTTLQIQSWSAENHWIFPSPETEYTYICEGGAMSLTRIIDGTLEYQLLGTGACAPLTRVFVQQLVDGKIAAEVLEYGCNAESSLGIKFLPMSP